MNDDTARMDYLERQHVTIKNDGLLIVNPPRLRAAIDVAMEQEESYECPIHGKMQGLTECPRC